MYVWDLNCDWIPHHKQQKEGRIPDEQTIQTLVDNGIKEVYIDTEKGIDVIAGEGQELIEVEEENQVALEESAEQPMDNRHVNISKEMEVARRLHTHAIDLVSTVMKDVKIGNSIDVKAFDDVADNMISSILRNQDALACLGRIRNKDSYLLEHSVNLAVLMGIFGKAQGLSSDALHQSVVGALLHDIGKVLTPDQVLHKAGKLTDDEFRVMKEHVIHSQRILRNTPGIPVLTINVAAQHHERFDGSGYPKGLKGDQICCEGRMVAIIDVYDAITADRVYHRALPPTSAMKKLLEWSKHHFDPPLVQRFIKAMGVYPVGSLVELESKRLALVIESGETSQIQPLVRVIYDLKKESYIKVEDVDLASPVCQDRIISNQDPRKFNIHIADFL